MRCKPSLFAALWLILAPGAAIAQAPPTPATPPQKTAPPAEQPSARCGAMKPQTTPDGGTVGRSSEPLGDKLAESDGVLCPPSDVDPAMRAPAPDTGNTPVIPPPGSPGGNPNVRPK
jgi:hypothetical protein